MAICWIPRIFLLCVFSKEENAVDYLMINLILSHLKIYNLVNVQVLYKICKQSVIELILNVTGYHFYSKETLKSSVCHF